MLKYYCIWQCSSGTSHCGLNFVFVCICEKFEAQNRQGHKVCPSMCRVQLPLQQYLHLRDGLPNPPLHSLIQFHKLSQKRTKKYSVHVHVQEACSDRKHCHSNVTVWLFTWRLASMYASHHGVNRNCMVQSCLPDFPHKAYPYSSLLLAINSKNKA